MPLACMLCRARLIAPPVASEYQRRLAAMVPTGDQEHHRRRMYVEEVSCLATVTHHYLAITRCVRAAIQPSAFLDLS
jgi:hypothetical protein